MKNYEYVDSCRTYEILLQDSGLLPKPKEDWNTFVPEEGMIAHVDENNFDYRFDGTAWIKIEEEPTEEESTEEESTEE